MKNNTDRWLGIGCAVLLIVVTLVVIADRNWSGSWILSFLLTVSLWVWAFGGLKKLEVGFRGQLLFLGERQEYLVEEGWRWAPFPFEIKTADCRQNNQKLDHLEVITEDKVRVEIDGTIIRHISDLNLYFGVNESGIQQGLDDIWDEAIRTLVATKKLIEVLKMQVDLGQKAYTAMKDHAKINWGIEITKVVVAGIKPNKEVAEDLALEERERLQKEGQMVEAKHIAGIINLLKKSEVQGGAGMSHGEAYETAQVITGKAKPKDIKGFTFNPEILAAIAKIVGEKKS